MPITLSYFESLNVLTEPEWPLFSSSTQAEPEAELPQLAVLSFSALTDQLEELKDMDDAAIQFFQSTVERAHSRVNLEFSLFLDSLIWQPKSVMVMHNKLWRKRPDAELLYQGQEEIIFEKEGKVKFATVTEVPVPNLNAALTIQRRYYGTFVLVNFGDVPAPPSYRSHVETMMRATFGPQLDARFNWRTTALELCGLGYGLLRLSGVVDERIVSVDVICPADKASILKPENITPGQM